MKNRSTTYSFAHDSRGATIVEFALGITVFAIMVLGTIEAARLLMVKSTLEHAANATAQLASIIPGIEISDSGCGPDQVIGTFCDGTRLPKFNRMLDILSDTVLIKTSLVVSDSSHASGVMLLRADGHFALQHMREGSIEILPTYVRSLPFVLLRPTDAGYFTGENPRTIEYPFEVPDVTMSELLSQFPIVVHLEAIIYPLIPFLEPYTLSARAAAYRAGSSRISQVGEVPLPMDPVQMVSQPQSPPPSGASSSGSSSSSSSSRSSRYITCGDDPGCPPGHTWEFLVGVGCQCVLGDAG